MVKKPFGRDKSGPFRRFECKRIRQERYPSEGFVA
jgi:hypothetical protein